MPYGDVDRIARMVPLKSRTLADALKASNELQSAYENEPPVGKLVDTAQGLEGIVHHVSTHAAGVLIASEPLTETVPLQRPVRGDGITAQKSYPISRLGLAQAGREGGDPRFTQIPGPGGRHQIADALGPHGGKVGKVYRQKFRGDIGRRVVGQKMHAGDHGVRRENQLLVRRPRA